ncbi:hypothetical protein D3C75_674810 [compost metagenome]
MVGNRTDPLEALNGIASAQVQHSSAGAVRFGEADPAEAVTSRSRNIEILQIQRNMLIRLNINTCVGVTGFAL